MIPIPANEHFRLDAIRALDIASGYQAPAVDELVRLAAQIFDVPIALVSIIDECNQNTVASVGVNFSEIPRHASICAYTVARNEAVVIPDTALDDRFHLCDMVAGPPYVRFYAGVPLVMPEGFVIGTFSVMDRRPRSSFGGASREQLEDLAGAAVRELIGGSYGRQQSEKEDCRPESRQSGTSPPIVEKAGFTAFADLAHQICTGLDEIKRASDALDAAPLIADNPDLRKLIDNIQSSTSFVRRIADRTLDLSRLRAGEVKLYETIVDFAGIVDTALARRRGLAHEHDIILTAAPMKLRPKILADALHLEQIVTNLMTNAIVHSTRGTVANCAITSAASGELIMTIGNEGAVLTDDEIRQAFEPFRVIGGDQRTHRTAGLGLPITRKLVELHGGAIDLHSSPDTGIEARLSFPAYRVLTWYSDPEKSDSAR